MEGIEKKGKSKNAIEKKDNDEIERREMRQ